MADAPGGSPTGAPRPTISTHVLDTEAGTPAVGVHVTLYKLGEDGFFARLSVDLRIVDTSRSYHVPLLLAPFSLTTYRGS